MLQVIWYIDQTYGEILDIEFYWQSLNILVSSPPTATSNNFKFTDILTDTVEKKHHQKVQYYNMLVYCPIS